MCIGNNSHRALLIVCREGVIYAELLYWSGIKGVAFGGGGYLSNLALKFILCSILQYKKKII